MKLATALFAALTLLASTAFAGPAKVALKGDFEFLSDAPLEKIFGTASGATGEITTDFDNLTATIGTITVPVAEMKTGNEMRDSHLKGSSWLDAGAHPNITFTIKKVEVKGTEAKGEVKSAELMATGDFTMHGVTTELTAPVTVKWKGEKVKVETKFSVKLADYKIEGNDGAVGKKVGSSIEIKGALKGLAAK